MSFYFEGGMFQDNMIINDIANNIIQWDLNDIEWNGCQHDKTTKIGNIAIRKANRFDHIV